MLKIRPVYSSVLFKILPWLWGMGGYVIYPFMFFRRPKEEISNYLFRHELEHIYQIRREGWIRFHAKYTYYLIKVGYRNNPYEIEARERGQLPLTNEEQKLKDLS